MSDYVAPFYPEMNGLINATPCDENGKMIPGTRLLWIGKEIPDGFKLVFDSDDACQNALYRWIEKV